MQQVSEEKLIKGPALHNRRLGKAPAKSHPKLLMASRFLDDQKEPPAKTNYWPKKTAFKPRHFGNIELGSCTRSKQAWAILRMERREQRRTVIITDEEVKRVYKDMTTRYYGADWVNDPVGSDTGAYELDALNDWRRKEFSIHDGKVKDRVYTIDAYVRVNQFDIRAVKNAIATAGAKGIAVCFNLPLMWAYTPGNHWDIPEGVQPIGLYMPGSWGGHSMWAIDYNEEGVFLDSTWMEAVGFISWRAFLIYCDEAYLVVDSINEWKKKKTGLDLGALKKAVNLVSSLQIK